MPMSMQELSLAHTHPDVFGRGVAEGWADPVYDPTNIDWRQRQAEAWVLFDVVDDRPVNPFRPDLPYGRGALGHWGEKKNTDAFVLAMIGGTWRLLLGERDDGNGWALPGGGLDPGESPLEGCLRELWEETGLTVNPNDGRTAVDPTLPPRWVPDPRAARESWQVTKPFVINLGSVRVLPATTCTSDLLRCQWVTADCLAGIQGELSRTGGKLFPSHHGIIRDLTERNRSWPPRP